MEISLSTINRNEVLQYLNWRGSVIPPDVDAQINRALQQMVSTVHPKYIWQLFQIEHTDSSIFLPELDLTLPGSDLSALLTDCHQLIFFAATLGTESERLIRSQQARDFAGAVILDCCGSAAIESICDDMEKLILDKLPKNTYFTDRFSPGYGDFPLDFQHNIITVLDTSRKIGLTLTESCIMIPRKSVTGIIGLADHPQEKRFRGCAYCSMFDRCTYRKAGKTCGK